MKASGEILHVGRVEARARYDLPMAMCAGIGKIITRWSYAEDCVQNLIYILLGVSDVAGRVAVREPRLTDRLSMVLDLLEVDDVYLPGDLLAEYKAMNKQASELVFYRDLMAHGTWSYTKEHKLWCVTNTRGNWDGGLKNHGLVGKKRIKPEGILFSPSDLNSLALEVEDLIEKLKTLEVIAGIASHQAFLEKSQKQPG
jgi:hypothetical protein